MLPEPIQPQWKAAAGAAQQLHPALLHLWRFRTDEMAREVSAAALSSAELQRLERITSDMAKRQFAAAQYALRIVLSRYLGLPAPVIEFQLGPHGKPYLADRHHSTLQFNLTHSHDWGLVGVTDRHEIGVDIEKVRDRPAAERLAARFYAEHERRAMAAASPEERTRIFFRLWTRKEGYLKATGTGLSVSLRAIDSLSPEHGPWWYRELAPAPDYVACVVGSGEPPDVSFYELHDSK